MQQKFKKGNAKHIKEIQAFEKYFKVVYNPECLDTTIYDVVVTLKEKFLKKLPNLKLPSYVTNKNRYEVAFNMYPPKFPPLLSSNIALVFCPPVPGLVALWILSERTKK